MQEQIARNVVEELSNVEKPEQLESQLRKEIAEVEASNQSMTTLLSDLYKGEANKENPWKKPIEKAFNQEGVAIKARNDQEAYAVWQSLQVDILERSIVHEASSSSEFFGPGEEIAHEASSSSEFFGPGEEIA